jgi:hypothetical protein
VADECSRRAESHAADEGGGRWESRVTDSSPSSVKVAPPGDDFAPRTPHPEYEPRLPAAGSTYGRWLPSNYLPAASNAFPASAAPGTATNPNYTVCI